MIQLQNYDASHSLKKNINLNTILNTSVQDFKTTNPQNWIFPSSVINKSDRNIKILAS
jgi:hypothetical protein